MEIVKGGLPNKKFQSPLIITAPSGKTATKTKSRLPLFDGYSAVDEDQIKQLFLARINEAEALLKQKRGSSQETILSSLCKSGLRTPRKANPGITTPNPFSFMTPGGRRESASGIRNFAAGRRESVISRRDSMAGRRYSVSGRRESLSGKTPCTQQKPRFPMSGRKMKLRASMQLKLVESQELQASRLAQVKRETWMDRQERAYNGLLNRILKQPMDPNAKVMEIKHSIGSLERTSSSHGMGIGSTSFDSSCSHVRNLARNVSDDGRNSHSMVHQSRKIISKAQTSGLRSSRETKYNVGNDLHALETPLNQICSLSELKRRLLPYLEESKCDRIISTITQIAKYIDDGRLRMKPNCVVLTDVALRTKALDVLFSYNPAWLRLGLAVVLGPIAFSDKNLSTPEGFVDEENHPETTFLEVLLEEHFFGDSTLAKQFATNRSIDGLYRDGFREELGKIILKRTFLLILVLDKIKSETALHAQHGIDGLDGGSPLLFQPNGCVKSSRQALEDFLSHVMQGEGDLIVHVGKLGYHVSHIQAPICEYDFEVRNVVDDLQDGVRLCRLAQLMSNDLSILVKIKFPCLAPKKRAHNCELALESFARSGVLLEDETGASITAEHISSGQREKTLSLIWNLILYLQVPSLVSHPKLFHDLERVGLVVNSGAKGYAVLDLLLSWVQAICVNVDGVTVQNFSTSFADGQVLCHLISNFLPDCLPCQAIRIPDNSALNVNGDQSYQIGHSEPQNFLRCENGSSRDRSAIVHNFQMVENAAELLGIAPEVLRLSDMVDGDSCTSERNIIIFVAHLCSALLNANPQDFPSSSSVVPIPLKDESNLGLMNNLKLVDVHPEASYLSRDATSENAATCIQAWYKGRRQRMKFERIKMMVIVLQRFVRGWLTRVRVLKGGISSWTEEDDDSVVIQCDENGASQQEVLEILSRHVSALQSRLRNRKLRAAFLSQRKGARTIQRFWRSFQARRTERRLAAAVLIQAFWRGHLVRNLLIQKSLAARIIQKLFRGYSKRLQIQKRNAAALLIQRFARGRIQKSSYRLHLMGIVRLQALFRGAIVRVRSRRDAKYITNVQAMWRGYCVRKLVHRWRIAVASIQWHFRRFMHRKHHKAQMLRIAQIQAAFRGAIVRNRLRVERYAAGHIQSIWHTYKMRKIVKEKHAAAVRIQSWYRCLRGRKWYVSYRSRIILLQATIRGHLSWKRFKDMRLAVIMLQSYWRGFLVKRKMGIENLAAMCFQKHARIYLQFHRKQLQNLQYAPVTTQDSYGGYFQTRLNHEELLAIVRIQSIWRGCLQRRMNNTSITEHVISRQATDATACVIHGHLGRQLVNKNENIRRPEHLVGGCAVVDLEARTWGCNPQEHEAAKILTSWAKALILRLRFLVMRSAAITIQKTFRGHKTRQHFNVVINCVCRIQAHWRGHKWRSGRSRMEQHMQELRLRMQSTAATVDNSQRLGNRLTEALSQLLSQKTVSGILHTCATIDMATEHSKLCCERLAEGGAVNKLLQLIQTVNRSPPHEQVLKHALSILGNLARFPNLAFSVASEHDSVNIIVEQLLIFRNKEVVFSKAMRILQHVSRTPGCVDVIQQDMVAIRRLQNVAILLERRFEVEKRNLDKLPPCAPSAVRQAADLKLKETVQQQQSIMSIMPGLVLKKVNTNPSPVSLSCIGKKVPFSTSAEERKRQRPKAGVVPSMKTSNGATANIKSGTLCSKIVTNIKETDIQGHVHRGSAPRPASLSVTNIEGSVKAVAPRPNRVSSGRRESASNTTITGFQTKAQNELPRIPLRDRSNSAAKVVRK